MSLIFFQSRKRAERCWHTCVFERPRPPRSAGICSPKAPISFSPSMVWSSTFSRASFFAGSFTSCSQKVETLVVRSGEPTHKKLQENKIPQKICWQAPQALWETAPAHRSGLQQTNGINPQPFCVWLNFKTEYINSLPEGKGNTWGVAIWPLKMLTAKDLDSWGK